MPILYDPSPYAVSCEGESLTEQEHIQSCDINIMIKNATRGLAVRGGPQPQYGYDDTTLTSVDFLIQKQKLEQELSEFAQTTELTEQELKHIPESVKQKIPFKKAKQDQAQNEQIKTNETSQDPQASISQKTP